VLARDQADGLERVEAGRERVRHRDAAPEAIFDGADLVHAFTCLPGGCVTGWRRHGQRERRMVAAIMLLCVP
jgi:hypothetical protein